jgi:hypothetical protein
LKRLFSFPFLLLSFPFICFYFLSFPFRNRDFSTGCAAKSKKTAGSYRVSDASPADPSHSEIGGGLSVMAGLDPAIHAMSARFASQFQFMQHYQVLIPISLLVDGRSSPAMTLRARQVTQ